MQLRKYYICDRGGTKVIEANIRVCPQGVFAYRDEDIKILKEGMIPREFKEMDSKVEAFELFMFKMIKAQELPPSGPKLDELIKTNLRQEDALLNNGRLDGLIPLMLIIKRCELRGFYFSPAKVEAYYFGTRMIGWNKMIFDEPKEWSKDVFNA